MAKLEVKIEGDAKGLSNAMGQASISVKNATDKINRGLQTTKSEIDSWDAAARKTSQANYGLGVDNAKVETSKKLIGQTREEIEKWDAAARANTNKPSGIVDPKKAEESAAAAKKLRIELEKAKQAADELNSAQGKGAGSASVFSRAITRQVAAQRAALSSANNLTRSMVALGTSGSGAASSLGIVARQLALLSTSGAATGVTLKSIASVFMGPAGIAIATSVAVTAITGYISSMSKAKQSTEETTEAANKYINSIKGLEGVMARGSANAQKEVSNLRLLYNATQDTSLSINDRKKAVDKLQEIFPSYFGKISDEIILAGKAKGAYDRLTTSLIASARARIAEEDIDKSARSIVSDEYKIANLNLAIQKEENKVIKNKIDLYNSYTDEQRKNWNISKDLTDEEMKQSRQSGELGKLIKEREATQTNVYRTTEVIHSLEKQITGFVKEGADTFDIRDKTLKKTKEKLIGIAGSLERLNAAKSNLENKISMAVDEKQVTALHKQLLDINLEITKLTSRQHEIQMKIALEKFGTPDFDFQGELNAALKGNIDFGKTRGAEAKEAEKATKDRISEERKASKKWLEEKQKNDLKYIEDQYKKQKESEFGSGMSRAAERGLRGLYGQISTIGQKGKEIYKSYEEEISKATGRQKEFLINIRDQQIALENSFGAALATITEGIASSMNDVFLNIASSGLKDALQAGVSNLENATGGLGSATGKLTVAAGLLGGVLSGVINKTSVGGQGAAGAISGAATGLLAGAASGLKSGSIVGAVVGGVAGLIGGIFSAKNAKKEEEIQRQQLEEQKRQTVLMERQNALAWGSSIEGRMVSGVGVISNVDLNSFGELTATVRGQDILFSLDRADRSSRNGS